MHSRSVGRQELTVTRDQQWSISAQVSSVGSVVECHTYDHFGKRTILAANGSTVRTAGSYTAQYRYTSRRHETKPA